MTAIDLDKLEALARAATPGPWRWADWSAQFGTYENPQNMLYIEHNATHPTATAPVKRTRQDGVTCVLRFDEPPDKQANANYIVATSPDVVIALIARIRELLAAMVRITNETPFPDELKGWTDQRAALVAEVGTLKARIRELEAERDMLRGVGCLEDGDGPCGACLKCMRARIRDLEWETRS